MRSLRELGDLKGRVAVITGGAGHIGRVVADGLAEMGASIALLDLDREATSAAAAALAKDRGVQALPLAVNLTDTPAVKRVPEQVQQALGGFDILVHSAALVGTSARGGWVSPFEEQSVETWREALEVNLTSAFVLAQAATPLLAASGHGSVILISSIYGVVGPDWRLYADMTMGSPAAYAASKGGALQLMRWLATTLAPGVRVNAVSPGGVFRDTQEPFLSRYIERTPLRRMATEEDLKGAIAFLASDLSAYVTGQNLVVDGGWTAW